MFISGVLFLMLLIFTQIDANGNITSTDLNKTCSLKYGRRLLKEDDTIIIQTKIYKVENCRLQRAYHTCGTDLWFMINIVCGAIESDKEENIFNLRLRRFTRQKLLVEACCLSACTVREMTRYCPDYIHA